MQAASVYCVVVLFWSVAADLATAAPRYSALDLGNIGGGGSSLATGISNRGQVVGYSAIGPTLQTHAFLYDGEMHDLGTLGGVNSYAFGINDAGQVVGYSETGGPVDPNGFAVYHAFVYSGGNLSDVGTLPGALDSRGMGINASGQVTGSSTLVRNLGSGAIIAAGGAIQVLGTPSIYTYDDTGFAINSAGWVAGRMNQRPFLYDGSLHWLINDGTGGAALGVNERGQVTGWANIGPAGHARAFVYDGILHDLGTLGGNDSESEAFAINNQGDVVGSASNDVSGGVFLYTGGTMYDLNALLDPDPGFRIVQVRAINDVGDIAGSAMIDGALHAVLLTPIPEPSGPVPLMFCCIGMMVRRRGLAKSEVPS
jgi:probable HAF family extracellular repeat protein